MLLYINALSKYIIAFLMGLYTFESLSVFRFGKEEKRKWTYIRQVVYLALLNLVGFLAIFAQTKEVKYLFYYAISQLLIFVFLVLYSLFYPKATKLIIHNMCMLLTIGFLILTRLDEAKAIRQLILVTISMCIALAIPHFIHQFAFLKRLKYIYALIGITGLSFVLILGNITHGSKLSFSAFGVTFQPSEFIKILFVFFIASALYQTASLKDVFVVSVFAGIHVLLLVASTDLGSGLIFFITYLFMIVLASGKIIYFPIGILMGAGASVLAYNMFSHVQVRVNAFLDPWSVIDSEGFQISQSLFSLGRGGFFGLGLCKGAPGDIPYVEQDFIFSAVAEELGLIVAFCTILISLSSFIMFMNISVKLKDFFYRLIAFGLAILYIFQVFLTVGGDTKFIPLTGVTFPLISYGGSSVLTTLIMFAVIEGLFMIWQDEDKSSGKRRKKRIRRDSYTIKYENEKASDDPSTDAAKAGSYQGEEP